MIAVQNTLHIFHYVGMLEHHHERTANNPTDAAEQSTTQNLECRVNFLASDRSVNVAHDRYVVQRIESLYELIESGMPRNRHGGISVEWRTPVHISCGIKAGLTNRVAYHRKSVSNKDRLHMNILALFSARNTNIDQASGE